MEGIRGHEIFDYLRKSRFSEEIAWYLFHQLINGLEAIHSAGYVHRDIKIENLMITVNAQGEPILKIIDFGYSIKIEKDKKYQPDGGSPSINDPCFYKEDLPYNPFKADIFSAGVVLLRMITNSNVFQKAEIFDLNYKMVIMERWK
jgi:serine/threonine protein kinase